VKPFLLSNLIPKDVEAISGIVASYSYASGTDVLTLKSLVCK